MCRHELGEKEVAVKRQTTTMIGGMGQGLFHSSNIVIEDDAQPVPPVAASRKIRIGNGIEVLESDVACVMQNAGVSRSIAIQTLRRNEGDIVNSILSICHDGGGREPEPEPRPPHDIMNGPTDDQTMKWALWRMFEGMRSGYQWNSYYDLRLRTKHYYGNEYWIHKDIHDVCDDGAIARGYESA